MKTKNNKTNDLLNINFYYYVKLILIKSPYIIIISALFAMVAIYLAKNYIKPNYKAVAKIIRYDKKISMPRDVPYKFQNFNYDTALQTVRTRKNLEEVIKKLDLDTTVEKLYSKFEVKRGRSSDIIEILYTNKDIDLAVKGANLLSTIFLKNFYEIQNAATNEIYNYYTGQSKLIKSKIDKLLTTREKFNTKNNILSLKIQQEYKYEQLYELSLNLIDAKVLQNEYSTKVEQIKSKLNKIPKEIQLNYSVRSADLKNIENKEKELSQLKQKYTIHNPKVKKVQNEIMLMKKAFKNKKIKKNIPDEITYGNNPLYIALKIELSQSNIGIVTATNRINEIKKQQTQIRTQIQKLNILQKEYDIIENQLEEKNTLFKTITNRLNEVKIAIESSQEDFKFLEKATKPRYPESNYKKVIVVLSIFTGVALSIAFLILRAFFDTRVKESYDIQERFDIKLLGKFLKTTNNKIIKKDTTNFINNFLKTVKNEKTILFSSDVKNTGKTKIIEKLTYYLSHHNKKVLYIQTVNTVTPEIENSVINYSHKDNLNINSVNGNIQKLYILDDENSNYLLTDSSVIKKLFNTLSNSYYDYVLFEIPSFQTNPYFFINMSVFSDMNCLVFRCNFSNRKTIIEMLQDKEKFNIKNIKGVLNDLDSKYL